MSSSTTPPLDRLSPQHEEAGLAGPAESNGNASGQDSPRPATPDAAPPLDGGPATPVQAILNPGDELPYTANASMIADPEYQNFVLCDAQSRFGELGVYCGDGEYESSNIAEDLIFADASKDLLDIMRGNIVIGEPHSCHASKKLIKILLEKGYHKIFFMEQVSQNSFDDIQSLLTDGEMSESLSGLFESHDSNHDVNDTPIHEHDKRSGFIDMFSSFSGKAASDVKLVPVDRPGFRYDGTKSSDSGDQRVINMNKDCEGFIKAIIEAGKDHEDYKSLLDGKCVFFVGSSHLIRHDKEIRLSELISLYDEPGLSIRLNRLLNRHGFNKKSYFSGVLVRDFIPSKHHSPCLVRCNPFDEDSFIGPDPYHSEYSMICDDTLLSNIESDRYENVNVLGFSDFSERSLQTIEDSRASFMEHRDAGPKPQHHEELEPGDLLSDEVSELDDSGGLDFGLSSNLESSQFGASYLARGMQEPDQLDFGDGFDQSPTIAASRSRFDLGANLVATSTPFRGGLFGSDEVVGSFEGIDPIDDELVDEHEVGGSFEGIAPIDDDEERASEKHPASSPLRYTSESTNRGSKSVKITGVVGEAVDRVGQRDSPDGQPQSNIYGPAMIGGASRKARSLFEASGTDRS